MSGEGEVPETDPTHTSGRAWREGDPVGRRHFVDVGRLRLESGAELPDARIAYETWGALSPQRDNAVLVLHALTGDSHVTGPAEPGHPTAGWWEGLIGPGAAIDTDRWFVVAPNALGGCQGSTGPSSLAPDGRAWGSRFPGLTIRDLVQAELHLAAELAVSRWALALGGSMGGMRALEWAVTAPDQVERLILLASTASASGDQIAWCTPQVDAIRADPAYHGGDYYDVGDGNGPVAGLAVARQIAHATYRSASELDARFGRTRQADDDDSTSQYAVESYLRYHGGKLSRRFDAGSYVVLTQAMSSHDVGRGRAGVEAALARVTARTVVAGVDSDRLYPLAQSQRLVDGIESCAGLEVIHSEHGHDGFLIEVDAVGRLASGLLGRCPETAPA